MKLLRHGVIGAEQPSLLDADGNIRDLSGHISDVAGDTLSDAAIAVLRDFDISSLPIVDPTTRLGACVGNVGKFICIGLNYADHAAEVGMELPEEPVIFFKATSAIAGSNDTVDIPRGSIKTDWEVELGVVIGKAAKYVPKEDALAIARSVSGFGAS